MAQNNKFIYMITIYVHGNGIGRTITVVLSGRQQKLEKKREPSPMGNGSYTSRKLTPFKIHYVKEMRKNLSLDCNGPTLSPRKNFFWSVTENSSVQCFLHCHISQ